METESRQAIARVLGQVPSGIFVLTVRNACGDETGMLASWVQQASFEPPMISVAVNRDRYVNDWLKESQLAGLSVVGASQKQLLRHFGRGFEPGQNAFNEIGITRGETGVPLLADALGYLEGRVCGSLPAGDHILYLLEIEAAGGGPGLDDGLPMVHIRKNGFRY